MRWIPSCNARGTYWRRIALPLKLLLCEQITVCGDVSLTTSGCCLSMTGVATSSAATTVIASHQPCISRTDYISKLCADEKWEKNEINDKRSQTHTSPSSLVQKSRQQQQPLHATIRSSMHSCTQTCTEINMFGKCGSTIDVDVEMRCNDFSSSHFESPTESHSYIIWLWIVIILLPLQRTFAHVHIAFNMISMHIQIQLLRTQFFYFVQHENQWQKARRTCLHYNSIECVKNVACFRTNNAQCSVSTKSECSAFA